jgi:serine/threonine protein kinase
MASKRKAADGNPFEDLPPFFQDPKVLGEGTYGAVWYFIYLFRAQHVSSSFLDTRTKRRVAVKRCKNPFEVREIEVQTQILQNESRAKATYREIILLKHLKHENIVSMEDLFFTTPEGEAINIYIVEENMDSDLSKIIESQRLSEAHALLISFQVLQGLSVNSQHVRVTTVHPFFGDRPP